MTKLIRLITATALLTGIAAYGEDDVKKNTPKKNEVLAALEKAGAPHFLKKTRVREVGPCKVETGRTYTYFHIFDVYVKDRDIDVEENRVAIFDNEKNYLGYYSLATQEVEEAEEGAFLVSLEGGDGDYETVQIPSTGPKKAVAIGGIPTQFIAAPKPEVPEGQEAEEAVSLADIDTGPKYRTWTITKNGKQLPVRAQFIETDGNKVILKSEAQGIEASFKMYELSKADLDYIKEQTKKD